MTDYSRDELKEITRAARIRIYDETEKHEKCLADRLLKQSQSKDNKMYWSICENKLWPKIVKHMAYKANQGLNDFTYRIDFTDFKGSEISIYKVKNKHINILKTCLESFARTKGFNSKMDVWVSGDVKISWK